MIKIIIAVSVLMITGCSGWNIPGTPGFDSDKFARGMQQFSNGMNQYGQASMPRPVPTNNITCQTYGNRTNCQGY